MAKTKKSPTGVSHSKVSNDVKVEKDEVSTSEQPVISSASPEVVGSQEASPAGPLDTVPGNPVMPGPEEQPTVLDNSKIPIHSKARQSASSAQMSPYDKVKAAKRELAVKPAERPDPFTILGLTLHQYNNLPTLGEGFKAGHERLIVHMTILNGTTRHHSRFGSIAAITPYGKKRAFEGISFYQYTG